MEMEGCKAQILYAWTYQLSSGVRSLVGLTDGRFYIELGRASLASVATGTSNKTSNE